MPLEFPDRLGFAIHRAGFARLAPVAEAVGTSPGTLTRYLDGDRARPDHRIVDSLATVLGVSYEWLSVGRGEVAPGEPGPDYRGTEKLDATLRLFPVRWSGTTIALARTSLPARQEASGRSMPATWTGWRDFLDKLRADHGHPSYWPTGRPKKSEAPILATVSHLQKRPWAAPPSELQDLAAAPQSDKKPTRYTTEEKRTIIAAHGPTQEKKGRARSKKK